MIPSISDYSFLASTPAQKVQGSYGAIKEEANKSSSNIASSGQDKFTLSEQGKEKSKTDATAQSSAKTSTTDKQALTEEEKKQVEQLKKRDAEVKAHEQAHKAVAGSLSSGSASYEYQSGPDGKRYAIGGEVSIDTSKVANDPAATIAKAQQVRRAANAPAQPSSQDRQVAAQATKMEIEAQQELAQKNTEKLQAKGGLGEQSKNVTGSTIADQAKSDAVNASVSTQQSTADQSINKAQEAKSSSYYQSIQSLANTYVDSKNNLSAFDFYA